jgi:hypothetical protein
MVETDEEERTRKRLRRSKKRRRKGIRMRGIMCTRREEGKMRMNKKEVEN